MNLFEECMQLFKEKAIKLSDKESKAIFKKFTDIFPITDWGRIDWSKMSNKVIIKTKRDILNLLTKKDLNNPVFILWDESSLPVVKSQLPTIFRIIDSVTAVSGDTWLFCPDSGYVIEFFHEGEIIMSCC